MDAAALTMISSLLIGGTATVATAWVTQRTLNKRELIRVEVGKREARSTATSSTNAAGCSSTR